MPRLALRVDISPDNVCESRDRLRAVINSQLDNDLDTQAASPAFVDAVEVILRINIVRGGTLADGATIGPTSRRLAADGHSIVRPGSLSVPPDHRTPRLDQCAAAGSSDTACSALWSR